MGSELVDGVFFENTWAAGTVAKSEHGTVDGEVGVALVLKLVVVGLAGDVLRRIGEG